MEQLIGIGLAGGQGIRCRPLTLKASGYLRAKAAVHFLGARIVHWVLNILREQGLDDAIMITQGKENRGQIKSAIGYGEKYRMRMRYSPIALDAENTGSGSALLSNLEFYNLSDVQALVFPTDSLVDIDLAKMREVHESHQAVATVATVQYPAEIIANRYGLIDHDEEGVIHAFLEKPSMAQIVAYHGRRGQIPPLSTSAGFYLINVNMLREIAKHPDIVAMRRTGCDIGGNLLPWLVEHHYPVCSYQITRMGDMGNIPSYIETMLEVLRGKFPAISRMLAEKMEAVDECYIDPTSYEMADPLSGLTLRDKITLGMVSLDGPVRIGKYVQIYPGVSLCECNIDDECVVHEQASIMRSTVGDCSIIGPYTFMQDSVLGTMVTLHSTRDEPVCIMDNTALGDEVVVRPGVRLSEKVKIFPRLEIPSGLWLTSPCEVETNEQLVTVAKNYAAIESAAIVPQEWKPNMKDHIIS